MMCSDGLSDMVRDVAIAKIMQGNASLEQTGKQLVAAANEGGGRDNISVVLTRAKDAVAKRGLLSRVLGR